jgi:two-component system chemotaxis response regulator CheB
MKRSIQVLIIDDSALARELLSRGLSQDPGINVVGTAFDPYDARDQIIKLRPDVLTLDVQMPRMDGLEFLKKLMPQYPLPVVVVSAFTEKGKKIVLEALELGAVDFVAKPRADRAQDLSAMLMELATKIKIASIANVAHWKQDDKKQGRPTPIARKALTASTAKVIAIGASTGGTEAIREVVTHLPADTPGIVIVQHMPPGFTGLYASKLNPLSVMEVKEAEDGEQIRAGCALIAPGARQLKVFRQGNEYKVSVHPGQRVNGHCPSVEVMMQSVAEEVKANAIGVMLTGMGRDGAHAMSQMRQAGARCIAQDEATSVVFGMPKVAFELGGAEKLVPLHLIASTIMELLSGMACR